MIQVRAVCSMLWFAAVMAACSGDGLFDDTAEPSDVATAADPDDGMQAERAGCGGIQRVKHVIVVMMENHSFDNYFGALPYAPGTPYHAAAASAGCRRNDHRCVDGLTCQADASGAVQCSNANLD